MKIEKKQKKVSHVVLEIVWCEQLFTPEKVLLLIRSITPYNCTDVWAVPVAVCGTGGEVFG